MLFRSMLINGRANFVCKQSPIGMKMDNLLHESSNILLVCPVHNLLTSLQQGIINCRKKEEKSRGYQCRVHICKSIENVLKYTEDPILPFDYVVFIAQPKLHVLDEIAKNLDLMVSVPRNKICIACLDLNYASPLKVSDVWDFSKLYQIHLLNGSLKNEDSIEHLSQRILNLMEMNCGLRGIPIPRKI